MTDDATDDRDCAGEPPELGGRICALWAVSLTLLVSLGAVCWLVVVPVMRAHSVVRRLRCEPSALVEMLGASRVGFIEG